MWAAPTMSFAAWLRPRKMLVLVVTTMAVFAATAAWLVWRLAEQDRTLQAQQIRERLESAADLVAGELREGLARLEGRLAAVSTLDAADRPAAAARSAKALTEDALIVLAGPDRLSGYPPGRLVYHPTLPAPPELPPDTYAEGEALEFRHRQYDGALAFFRRRSASTDPRIRAGGLLRMARVQRKAGQTEDALATYDALAVLGDTSVEGLPAELRARHARCAVLAIESRLDELRDEADVLRQRLQSGSWTIDRAAFLHYTDEAGMFLRMASGRDEAEPRTTVDQPERSPTARKGHVHQLATGVDLLWTQWRRTAVPGAAPAQGIGDGGGVRLSRALDGTWMLLLWRNTGDAMVGLVGGPDLMWQEVLSPIEPLLARQGAAVMFGDGAGQAVESIGFPDGVTQPDHRLTDLASGTTGADATRAPRARRTRAESGLPWELQIVSADPSADRATVAGRQRVLLTVSGLVVLVMAAAIYFSSRAVARELAVARVQSGFVSAVSHDFRTPLTALRQATEALGSERVAAARRPAYYDIQLRAINRLQRLVEGLLDFGRIEAGGLEFERRPIRVQGWIEGVVGAFQAEVDKQGYAVELSWTGAEPVAESTIDGDEPALTRAMWNLLDNAVKYSPDAKTVWVEARIAEPSGPAASGPGSGRDIGALILHVRDDGVGIDPAEHRTIFGKFVRGSAAATSGAPGTGLGLAMVEHIVKAHGGEIEVEGAPGHGSTFSVRLPLGSAQPA